VTTKYYINTTQRGVVIPVYVEQQMGTDVINLTPEQLTQAKELLTPDQLNYIKLKQHLDVLKYSRNNNSYYFVFNAYTFYTMLFRFKSRVKGIVKLRELAVRELVYDDDSNLFIHKLVALSATGITWKPAALNLALAVVAEQQSRWLRVKQKHSDRSLSEQLDAFIKLATGQQDYYYSDKLTLWLYLEAAFEVIQKWNEVLNLNPKTVEVNNNLFTLLYFNMYGRTKNNYKLGDLGFIFRELKKPLNDLLLTFTQSSVELKFLKCKE